MIFMRGDFLRGISTAVNAVKCLPLWLLLLPGQLYATENGSGGEELNVRLAINDGGNEGMRLEARHVPLREVLETVADKTGVKLHYTAIPEEFVSVNCAAASLKPLMECLLGADANLIYRFKEGSLRDNSQSLPEEVWVLESSFKHYKASSSSVDAGQCQSVAAGQDATKSAAEQTKARQEETANLLAMTASEDAEERAQALAQLAAESRADDESVRKSLMSALHDGNAEVRAQAVYGLSRLDGADSAAVVQAALHDSDISVRLMAVDSVGSDAALLQEALADSDALVREAAAAKLQALTASGDSQ